MSNPLTRFLVEISLNPKQLREFKLDPLSIGRDAGLTAEQIDALVGGDTPRVSACILRGSGLGELETKPTFVEPVVVYLDEPVVVPTSQA